LKVQSVFRKTICVSDWSGNTFWRWKIAKKIEA